MTRWHGLFLVIWCGCGGGGGGGGGFDAGLAAVDPAASAALPRGALFSMDDAAEIQALAAPAGAPPLTAVQLHRLIADQNAVLSCATTPTESLLAVRPTTMSDGTSRFASSVQLGRVPVDVQAVVKPDPSFKDSYGTTVTLAPRGGASAPLSYGFFSAFRDPSIAGTAIDENDAEGHGALAIKAGLKVSARSLGILGDNLPTNTTVPIGGDFGFSVEHTAAASIWQAQFSNYQNGACPTEAAPPVPDSTCPAGSGKHQVHKIASSQKFPGKTVVLARAFGSRNVVAASGACEQENVRVRRVVGAGGWGRATITGGDVVAGSALLFREVWSAAGVTYRRSWICPFNHPKADAPEGSVPALLYTGCTFALLSGLPAVGGTSPELVRNGDPSNPQAPANLQDFKAAVALAVGADDVTASAIALEGDPVSDRTSLTADESISGIVAAAEVPDETSTDLGDLAVAADGMAVGGALQAVVAAPTAPGRYRQSIVSGGLLRTYILVIPEGYDGSSAVPLVLVLHGYGMVAGQMESLTQLDAKGHEANFVVAYLNGTGDPQYWNTGITPDPSPTADDVGFVKDLIAKLEGQLKIEGKRIYATGFSNGAFMCHRLAAELPGTLAAVASVEGTIGVSADGVQPYKIQTPPTGPIPVIIVHERTDTHIPYDGGYGCNAAHFWTKSVADAVAFWTDAGADSCPAAPQVTKSGNVVTSSFALCDGTPVTLMDSNVVSTDYTGCAGGTEVLLDAIIGGDHIWPSPSNDAHFPATDAIWAFFARHSRAEAQKGDLTWRGCWADDGSPTSCMQNPGLDFSYEVVVSPDDTSVYAVGLNDSALVVYDRDVASGALTYATCFDDVGATSCGANQAEGLGGARAIAVSADGKSVYVVSANDNSIVRFARDPATRALTPGECLGAASGCTPAAGLAGARQVKVSADGTSVYVAAFDDNVVTTFSRDPGTGKLTLKGSIAGLHQAHAVAVSPDDRFVYVAAAADSAVTIFARDPGTGALTRLGCVADVGAAIQCAGHNHGLGGARSIAIAHDGSALYVAGYDDDAISIFQRDPTSGMLTARDCVNDKSSTPAENCSAASSDGLRQVHSLALSADDGVLYATGRGDSAVAWLARDATSGALKPQGCIEDLGASDPCTRQDGLFEATSVAVSADGKSLYAAARMAGSVVWFDVQP